VINPTRPQVRPAVIPGHVVGVDHHLAHANGILNARRAGRQRSTGRAPARKVSAVSDNSIELHIGREELVLRKRYEILSVVNDILVAVWFVIGSILFFSDSTATAGTWLFLLGSVELLVRPLIRLTRRVHIGRVGGAAGESARDF